MRDLAVLLILVACIRAAFYSPWLGVLGLAVFGYLRPHGYATGFMHDFPVFKVLFVFVVIALILARQRPQIPRDWRLVAILLLWGCFFLSSYYALIPWNAWPRFIEVSKVFLTILLTLYLIDSRDKLYYLIVTIAASFALLTLKGGYWAVMTGFSDRVYGPPDSHFAGNNHFAVAVVMNIPLLVLWLRETRTQWLRYVLMGAIGLSIAAALSSWSRGALLALGAVLVLLLWHSKRKYLALPIAIAGVFLVFYNLPEQWFERMDTIATYQQDASAEGRLVAWRDGLEIAQRMPWLGTGFDSWYLFTVTTGKVGRDWHSAYVEILAEHGVVAFTLWLALLLGTLLSLTRLAWIGRRSPDLAWLTNYSTMLRASLVGYAIGSAFSGISYWDLLYQVIAIAILLNHLALPGRNAAHTSRPPSNSPRSNPGHAPAQPMDPRPHRLPNSGHGYT